MDKMFDQQTFQQWVLVTNESHAGNMVIKHEQRFKNSKYRNIMLSFLLKWRRENKDASQNAIFQAECRLNGNVKSNVFD